MVINRVKQGSRDNLDMLILNEMRHNKVSKNASSTGETT